MKKALFPLFAAALAGVLPARAITGTGSAGDPFVVGDAADWEAFAADVGAGANAGAFWRLAADVTNATATVGTDGHPFSGVFDGAGHVLHVAIADTANQGTAPFRWVAGATVSNLTVAGTVVGTTHAAGLVGFSKGGSTNLVSDCVVDVAVSVPATDGNLHAGGVAGHAKASALAIRGTVFRGSIHNNGSYVGGLVGWCDAGASLSISNCLFEGSCTGWGLFHPVAVRDSGAAVAADARDVWFDADPTLFDPRRIAASGLRVHREAPAGLLCTAVDVAVDGSRRFAPVAVHGLEPLYAPSDGPIQPVWSLTDAAGAALAEDVDFTAALSPAVVQAEGAYTLALAAKAGGRCTGSQVLRFSVEPFSVFSDRSPELAAGTWYVDADGQLGSIRTTGNVKLVLGRGRLLRATQGVSVPIDAHLTIDGEGTLIATGYNWTAGIGGWRNYDTGANAPGGAVTIDGGIVVATGDEYGAGIGGGYNGRSGRIEINGGTVVAIGGKWSAGIGCGGLWSGGSDPIGDIAVNGGRVFAVGGSGGAGIGGGSGCICGAITVAGGSVRALGTEHGSGIGCGGGGAAGTLSILGGRVAAASFLGVGVGNGSSGTAPPIVLDWTDEGDFIDATSFAGSSVEMRKAFRYRKGGADLGLASVANLPAKDPAAVLVPADGADVANTFLSGVEHKYLRTGADLAGTIADAVRLESFTEAPLERGVDYEVSFEPAEVRAAGAYELTVSGIGGWTGSRTVRFEVVDWIDVESGTTFWGTDGFYRALGDVTLDARVVVSGKVELLLCDGATLTAPAGISVTAGNRLDVRAESDGGNAGALVATAARDNDAGIGGDAGGGAAASSGTVAIHGGRVTASCAAAGHGAGIGGGRGGAAGSVAVDGGTVVANGSGGAGIGGGFGSDGAANSIEISGGIVRATVSGGRAAAIGAGGHSADGRHQGTVVRISGGAVTAMASGGGAGIGTGDGYAPGCGPTVEISGGSVEASSIGGPDGHSAGVLSITGGTVSAAGRIGGTSIPGDKSWHRSSLRISLAPGETVTAGGFTARDWAWGEGDYVVRREGSPVLEATPENLAGGGTVRLFSGTEFDVTFFDATGGNALASHRVAARGVVPECDLAPMAAGLVFAGWKTPDGTAYDTSLPVLGDLSLLARYEAAPALVYADADGAAVTANGYRTFFSRSDAVTFDGGVFAPGADAVLPRRVTVSADSVLVLRNGTTFTAAEGILVLPGASLTVCAELPAEGAAPGALVAASDDPAYPGVGWAADPEEGDAITVWGGAVTVSAPAPGASLGCGEGASGGRVAILGGRVAAGAAEGDGGIAAASVRLGWTDPEGDSVRAASYAGAVSFRDKFWLDGTEQLATAGNAAGRTIVPAAGEDFPWCVDCFGTEGDPYRVGDAAQWDAMCEAVATGFGTTGVHVRLVGGVGPVTNGLGTPDCPFAGVFDGGSNALEVALSGADEIQAPFGRIAGATIRNLVVTGAVSGARHSAGLVGAIKGGPNLVENCRVAAAITVPDYGGGFVGHGTDGYDTAIRGCSFAGTIAATNSALDCVATFWGWSDGGTLSLEECLDASGSTEPVGRGTVAATVTDVYYLADGKTAGSGGRTWSADKLGARAWPVALGSGVALAAAAPRAAWDVAGFSLSEGSVVRWGGAPFCPAGGSFDVSGGETEGWFYDYAVSDATGADLTGAVLAGTVVTMPNRGVAVEMLRQPDPEHFSLDDGVWTIRTAAGWDVFGGLLLRDASTFDGKTVRLAVDIPVTNGVGSTDAPFRGTFDGGGHKVTATLSGPDSFVAPFVAIDGATVSNLWVDGSSHGRIHSSGLVGWASGTNRIENCRVTARVSSDERYCGGFVGHGGDSATTLRGCAFAGRAANSAFAGLLWGWSDAADVVLVDCFENTNTQHPVGRGGTASLNQENVFRVNGSKEGNWPSTLVSPVTTARGLRLGFGEPSAVYDTARLAVYAEAVAHDGVFHVRPSASVDVRLEGGAWPATYRISRGSISWNGDGWTLGMPYAGDAQIWPVAIELPDYLSDADARVVTNYCGWAQTFGEDAGGTHEAAFLLDLAPSTPLEGKALLRVESFRLSDGVLHVELASDVADLAAKATDGEGSLRLGNGRPAAWIGSGLDDLTLVPMAVTPGENGRVSADVPLSGSGGSPPDRLFLRPAVTTRLP